MSENTTSTGWILAASPMILGLRKLASSWWMPRIQASTPAAVAGDVVAALQTALQKIVVGDPRVEGVRMGPLVSQEQRTDVLERVEELNDNISRMRCGERQGHVLP